MSTSSSDAESSTGTLGGIEGKSEATPGLLKAEYLKSLVVGGCLGDRLVGSCSSALNRSKNCSLNGAILQLFLWTEMVLPPFIGSSNRSLFFPIAIHL